MKDPCKGCVVDPMCRVGCEKLWIYRNYAESEDKRRRKISMRLVYFSVLQSLTWSTLLWTDVVKYSGDWGFLFRGEIYSILWYYIPYTIVIGTAFTLMFSAYKLRKKKRGIESGARSEYIWRKEMEGPNTQGGGLKA